LLLFFIFYFLLFFFLLYKNEILEVIESNEIELVSLCSNGYIYYLTCTTLRPPPNTDESNEISHQSYKIQKKKFFKTDNDESEEDNEEDSYNTSI